MARDRLIINKRSLKLGDIPSLTLSKPENISLLVTNHLMYWNEVYNFIFLVKPNLFKYCTSKEYNIVDQSYLDNMSYVAEASKKFSKFLVFTSNFTLDFSDVPDNLSVVLVVKTFSKAPNIKLPLALTGIYATNSIHCKKEDTCDTCKKCWNLKTLNKNVVFEDGIYGY